MLITCCLPRIDIDALFNNPSASGSQDPLPGLASKAGEHKPKTGRVISNEDPVGDFLRQVEHGGNITTKAVSCCPSKKRLQERRRLNEEQFGVTDARSGRGQQGDCLYVVFKQQFRKGHRLLADNAGTGTSGKYLQSCQSDRRRLIDMFGHTAAGGKRAVQQVGPVYIAWSHLALSAHICVHLYASQPSRRTQNVYHGGQL